jgi:hypothetical protein
LRKISYKYIELLCWVCIVWFVFGVFLHIDFLLLLWCIFRTLYNLLWMVTMFKWLTIYIKWLTIYIKWLTIYIKWLTIYIKWLTLYIKWLTIYISDKCKHKTSQIRNMFVFGVFLHIDFLLLLWCIFRTLYNLLWMVTMFVYLPMVRLVLERHSQW